MVCVPSSFFIGENGIPLEVIAGSVSAEELIKRINRVDQVLMQCVNYVQLTFTATGNPTVNYFFEITVPGVVILFCSSAM